MAFELQTERFLLREHTQNDAPDFFELNEDPDVIKYTGDARFADLEAAKTFLENYDHYQKYGFGRWAVIAKSNGEYMGWCGLKYTASLDEYDIGFRLSKKHWNKGFASEVAKACLEAGFSQFKIQTIVGRALKKNVASIRVLEKIGLTYKESRFQGLVEECIYVLSK